MNFKNFFKVLLVIRRYKNIVFNLFNTIENVMSENTKSPSGKITRSEITAIVSDLVPVIMKHLGDSAIDDSK